jgi:hypothetical protein
MPKVVWVDPETGKQNTKSFSYDKEGRADAQAYAKKVDGRVEDKKVTRQGDDGPILEGFRELLSRSGAGQTPGDYMQSTMPSGSELTGRVPRVPPADNRDIVNEGVKDYSKVQRSAYYPKDPRQFEIRTGRVQGPHISDVDDENPRLKRRRR